MGCRALGDNDLDVVNVELERERFVDCRVVHCKKLATLEGVKQAGLARTSTAYHHQLATNNLKHHNPIFIARQHIDI